MLSKIKSVLKTKASKRLDNLESNMIENNTELAMIHNALHWLMWATFHNTERIGLFIRCTKCEGKLKLKEDGSLPEINVNKTGIYCNKCINDMS